MKYRYFRSTPGQQIANTAESYKADLRMTLQYLKGDVAEEPAFHKALVKPTPQDSSYARLMQIWTHLQCHAGQTKSQACTNFNSMVWPELKKEPRIVQAKRDKSSFQDFLKRNDELLGLKHSEPIGKSCNCGSNIFNKLYSFWARPRARSHHSTK